ncbi:DUF4292 domain-containing protein [Hallella sp.]|uniref:DUF4292 domain-containing protein n=1 Tax=Hallella sp. TaxID=2980186 RepID=UPI00307957DE
MKTSLFKICLICAPLALASCGAKKSLVKDNATVPTTQTTHKHAEEMQLAFVQKVSDQKVYAKNIVSGLSFTANMDGKSITLPGALRMRRDQVIRLQIFIPYIGTEAARIEFTPDYVLVVDRLHKQYVKGDYNQLDFLRNNGLSFYSLQALFWNQLMLPGTNRVSEGDLAKFDVNLDGMGQNVPIMLKNGNLAFTWQANRNSGLIAQAVVAYTSRSQGNSTLTWKYDNFKALGAKSFPATQEFSFATNATKQARKATVKLALDALKTSDDWEANTVVSSKYKKVEVQDILGKLLEM